MRVFLFSLILLLAAPAVYAQNPLDELAEKATTVEELLNLGHLNVEAKRDKEAKRLFKTAEVRLKNPVEAKLGLAELHVQNVDLQRAKYTCRKLEREFPNSPIPKICFGRMWLRFDRSARAIEDFEAVRGTGDVRAILGLAKTYDYMNEYDNSIALYKEAAEKGAGYEAYLGLGLVMERKGDADAALTAVKKAVETEPHSSLALYHLGRIMKKGPKAAEYVRKALLIRPNWADAYGTLGEILIKNDASEAAAVFEKAISLEPDRGSFHIGLGTAMYHLEKIEEARSELDKALKLLPNHVGATQMLAEVELKSGNTERAIQLAEQAVQLSPNNAEICFDTAYMFYETKRYTQANAYFLRTLSMTPGRSDAMVYLGDIACERRLYADGVAHYNDALSGKLEGRFSRDDIKSRIKKCTQSGK